VVAWIALLSSCIRLGRVILRCSTILPCRGLSLPTDWRSPPVSYPIMSHHIEEKATVEQRTQHADFEEAKQAAEEEHQLTLRQAIRLHPKAIAWSVLLSTSIIMEGYDIVLYSSNQPFRRNTATLIHEPTSTKSQHPGKMDSAMLSALGPLWVHSQMAGSAPNMGTVQYCSRP
jgi:hypothetical protein